MQQRKYLFLALVLVLLFGALGGQAASAAPNAAVVTLSTAQASYAADQAVVVKVTITNPTNRPVKILKWYTAADSVEEPLFSVSRDGVSSIAYLGAHYKRPAPTTADYVTLKPGASLVREVDLGAFYDLSVTGSYTLRYDVGSLNLHSEKGAKGVEHLVSSEITVQVAGRAAQAPGDVLAPNTVNGTTTFNRCTTSQQADLLTARTQASTYVAGAASYLQGSNPGLRYTTWFGVFDTARYNTVKTNYSAIGNAMDNAAVTFDCGCKKRYYAYVYPNQPYTIYLCSVFWTAPMTGTDSKAGTLIHEMSHFNVVAGTDDWVYGQSGAKSLAISDPNKAIANADNHEYFAENTPALP